MWIVWSLIGLCVLLLIRPRRGSRYHPLVRRLLKHHGHRRIDYAIVHGGAFRHPIIHWDTMRNVVQRIHAGEDYMNLKITDPGHLRSVGLPEDATLRIQSPNFHYGLHYDCNSQHVTQLSGRKRWILFDRHFDTVDGEVEYVKNWWSSGSGIDDLAASLRRCGVEYTIVTTAPGDDLSIPVGRWHQTEGTHDTDMNILVNYQEDDTDEACNARFARTFPDQQAACDNNECRY